MFSRTHYPSLKSCEAALRKVLAGQRRAARQMAAAPDEGIR